MRYYLYGLLIVSLAFNLILFAVLCDLRENYAHLNKLYFEETLKHTKK